MATRERLQQVNLDLELQALHQNIISEERTFYATPKQVQTLASLIGKGLQDKSRSNRMAVTRLLCGTAVRSRTGYEVRSTKNIPGEVGSILIDLLKANEDWELSAYGRTLLLLAETRVKNSSDTD